MLRASVRLKKGASASEPGRRGRRAAAPVTCQRPWVSSSRAAPVAAAAAQPPRGPGALSSDRGARRLLAWAWEAVVPPLAALAGHGEAEDCLARWPQPGRPSAPETRLAGGAGSRETRTARKDPGLSPPRDGEEAETRGTAFPPQATKQTAW
ncbi:uncharacterized protein LOC131400149 isoform X1 [Diceros bicornis minor]|uniref:uncharacterized protein LOC131400149 isoform X1 n=1 Tax=Diceros bicornis minor TaxID=77932 RepID=UPI0026EAB1F7|nr:uncharacterized protein LOC131400149 isoform X1 [Diceros bicornis minor]